MRRANKCWLVLIFGLLLVCSGMLSTAVAQDLGTRRYNIGSPTYRDIWVNPVSGSDSRTGLSRSQAVRTLGEAWNRIPIGVPLQTGYRIRLTSGNYLERDIPNYLESRYGSAAHPILIESVDGRGAANLLGDLNIFDVRYLYIVGVDILPDPAGDALHCERCDHLLLRGMELSGGALDEAHETIKINQSQYVYIEDCNVHSSYENPIDFVAVQYGHIIGNRIHDGDDWCIYLKGGSSHFVIEGNEIYDCGTGGFTAGQGTGFEYMTSPWLHYEAYNIKVVNNIIHDTEGAGLGVNGGYNILLAYNTMYRVGSRSHTIEIVFGLRSCDGETARCAANRSSGGWGPAVRDVEVPIGNRNVFVYNNIIYNPTGVLSPQHFAIYGPRAVPGGSSAPNPAITDTNLQIRGNVIWNGTPSTPLGIEDGDQGCRDSNETCNATQLRRDNLINVAAPELTNPETGDFSPRVSGNLFSFPGENIPSFSGTDRISPPLAPQGNLGNTITRDFLGETRGVSSPPGAITGANGPPPEARNYLPWNSFLRMVNVLELVNPDQSDRVITVMLLNNAGRLLSSLRVRVRAGDERDIVLNDMERFEPNAVGLVGLDYDGPAIANRISYYRKTANRESYEFAYTTPSGTPLQGRSWVSFNTFQPSVDPREQGLVTSNWLTLVNLDRERAEQFTVNTYDGEGALLRRRVVTVPLLSRVDIEAGHVLPGRQRAGTQEIIPMGNAFYFAQLIRYGTKGAVGQATPEYAFALALASRKGGPAKQCYPISTTAANQNWFEMTNVSTTTTQVQLRLYGKSGEQINRLPIRASVPPRAERHFSIAAFVGNNRSGQICVSASRSAAIVGQSVFYHYNSRGGISALYGTQLLPSAALEKRGSYNLFLGAYNWLRVQNSSSESVRGELQVTGYDGIARSFTLPIPAYGSIDLPLHEGNRFGTRPNSYGLIRLRGRGLQGELLRVRPSRNNEFDFIMSTVLR